jgi:CspA family cold shock protein
MATTASSVSTSTVTSCTERFTGRVKWFNNKAGYGFVTVTDGPKAGGDIFVHHSSIKVDSDQYKYLVQGEYVEFSLSSVSSGTHEFQAGEVSGIKGGKLMCETRHELRTTRSQYKQTEQGHSEEQVPVFVPRSVQTPERKSSSVKPRGQGPRDAGSEWTPVKKTRQASQSTKPTTILKRTSSTAATSSR